MLYIYQKSLVLIFLLFLFNSVLKLTTGQCGRLKWQCDDGQCINYEDRCDGREDCKDGSDEIYKHCIHLPCPAYAFHCSYGGCVPGSVICDKNKDCVDGSDETELLCNPELQSDTDIRKYLSGSCKNKNSMECKPGECIDIEKKCDGKKDCSNGRDETVEICSTSYCPPFAFRCAYGGCIDGSARCNEKKDCADGSDEADDLCYPVKESEYCDVPKRDKLQIKNYDRNTGRVAYGKTLEFSCSDDWKLLGAKESTCDVEGWSNQLPYCTKYCPNYNIRRGISSKAVCTHNEKTLGSTNSFPIGAVAHITCQPGYMFHEKEAAQLYNGIRCNSNGEWSGPKRTCTPICGIANDNSKNAQMSWNVSIYRWDDEDYIYKHQCFGVIVSPKIVLSAESCFKQIKCPDIDEHDLYNIVGGNYIKEYRQSTDIQKLVFNVSEIHLTSSIQTIDSIAILVLVNYFDFSASLAPICIQLKRFSTAPYTDIKARTPNKILNSNALGSSVSQIYKAGQREVHYLIAISINRNTSIKTSDFESSIRKYIERYDHIL